MSENGQQNVAFVKNDLLIAGPPGFGFNAGMASRKPKEADRPSSSLPSFCLKLKSARILAGYESAKDSANDLGLEVETYRRYERGETDPNLATLLAIRRLTKQSLDVLISGGDIVPILNTPPAATPIRKARTKAE